MASGQQNYDVFLSYNTADRVHVEAIARALREHKLNVFLDRWYLAVGKPWPQELESVLASCGAVAVCLGPNDMGPWQQREVNFALARQNRDKNLPVIPVLMPQSEPVLGFLGQNTWVDLRPQVDDPTQLAILASAIRGEPPGPDIAERVRATLAQICPYRGLLYFREEDKDFFFGRDSAIADLEQAIERKNFVAVVGASGSGKSSVVRAGLIPALRATRERAWEIVTLVPGNRPLHALSAALMPLLEPDLTETDRLLQINKQVQALQSDELSLRDIVERVLAKQSGTERILLFVDQWEELYTLTSDDAVRQRFIDELLQATSENPAIYVVLTIRGDFVGHAFAHRALVDRWKDAQVSLGPMKRDELECAILEPAGKVNLGFAPGLVQRILDDVGGEPGNLPLLEFVLKQLWEQRRGGEMSHEAYEAMGQLRGAIAAKAESVYDKLSELERQALQRVFMQMVRPGENAQDTRRRAALDEIGAASLPLVRRLADRDHRLLITSKDSASGADTVEVSHEALIRNWQRLKDWLATDREFLLWRERFRAALAEWEAKREDNRLLLRDPLLAEAESWHATHADQLSPNDVRFLRTSLDLRTAEQRAEADRQRRELELVQEQVRLQSEKQEADLKHAQLAAAQAEREKLQAEEFAQRSRNKSIQALVLAVISLGALVWALYSRQQAEVAKAEAQGQARNALSRQLLARSDSLIVEHPDQSALLALLARRASALPETDGQLRWLDARANFHRVMRGHGGSVSNAQLSADGKIVVTASWDGTARLWERSSGKELMVMRGHDAGVLSAQISGDGKTVVTASDDGTARLWEAGSGRVLALLRGHQMRVLSAQFNGDGKTVVTASWDNTARLWDVVTGKELAVLRGHEDGASLAQFSADGKTVVTASSDKTARLWEVASGAELAVLRGHEGRVWSAQFSADGGTIVTASEDKTARLWARSGAELAVLRGHDGSVSSAQFSSDGKMVVTASEDKTARLWEAASGKELAVLLGHEGEVWSAQFGADGKTVVTASRDKTARLWEVASGAELAVLRGHEDSVSIAQFSADGKTVVTASRDKTARLWETVKGGDLVVLRGHESEVWSAHISVDGKTAVTTSRDKTVRLWEAASGKQLSVLRGHEAGVSSAQFSADGKMVVTASWDNTARLWDVVNGKEVAVLRGHEGGVSLAHFSTDGKTVVTASSDKTARLWGAASGKELAVLRGHEQRVLDARFSPDGKTVVTAGWDGTARLWEAASGKELVVLRGHEAGVSTARFRADGKTVVTASSDKTARLWEVHSGRELVVLRGHESEVWSAQFSADGKMVVTASKDTTARLWEANSGKELVVLRGHQGGVSSAQFSNDDKTVATASSDKTARLWEAGSGKELVVLRGHEGSVSSAQFSTDSKTLVTVGGNRIAWSLVGSERTARLWHCMVCGTADEAAASLARKIGRELTAEERRRFGVPDDLVSK